jgi:hypothetical protein
LSEVRDAKRESGIKICRKNITPESEPEYSGSKLSNWMQDRKELEDKEVEIQGELLVSEGETIEVGIPTPKAELVAPLPDPDLETTTKNAAKEIALLLDRSNKRAVDITTGVINLWTGCRSRGKIGTWLLQRYTSTRMS